MARSTLSDKLNAKSFPDWPFVPSFVSVCLAHADQAGIRLPTELRDLGHWDRAHPGQPLATSTTKISR